MRYSRLLLFGLFLSIVAPSMSHACDCAIPPTDTAMREGVIVARVHVLQSEVLESRHEFGVDYYTIATAYVQESYSGPFPGTLIEIRTTFLNNLCHGGGIPPVGWSELIVLSPSAEAEDVYFTWPCLGYVVFSDDFEEVIESYAAMREQGDGVWIDTIAFMRLINSGPTLAELQQAFPEVEIIAHDSAPPELQVHFMDYTLAEVPPGLDEAFASHRTDQSRFVARIRDGVVIRGEFR